MTINWGSDTAKTKIMMHLRKTITAKSYCDGEWSIMECILSSDNRSHMVWWVLEGLEADLKRSPEGPMKEHDGFTPFFVRLKVLTRQACIRDKSGRKMFSNREALDMMGDESAGDFIPQYSDVPEPGDVVEWKGYRRSRDDETGGEVSRSTIRRWIVNGERPEVWHEFIVDNDGCISVTYPHFLEMLRRKGERVVSPRWRKAPRGTKKARRITNWWFREVPRDYSEKKKKIAKEN